MNMKGVLQITILMLAATLLMLPVSGAFTVTNITPDSGINTEPVFITNLSGTDFPEEVGVNLTMDGYRIPGLYVTRVDATKLACVFDITGMQAGTWDVVVVNKSDGSEVIGAQGFSVINPAPTITGITPATGVNNATVRITDLAGTNFLPNASVRLEKSGVNITGTNVNVVSDTRIRCRFDITGADPGWWDVVVTNEDGQSIRRTGLFTITYPKPEVVSIFPSQGKNNEVIGITNLSGQNFRNGALVILAKEGEDNITTINDPIITPEKILCFFDLTGKAVGEWNVVVSNIDGQYGILPSGFNIFYPQAPVVTGITPDTSTNDAPLTALITGTGFQPGAAATLLMDLEPGIPGTNVVVINATTISCEFNITGVRTGAWDIRVANDDGQSFTKPGVLEIRNPAPILMAVDPDNGLNSEPAKLITLSGTGFKSGATVVFSRGAHEIDAFNVIFLSSMELTCAVDLTGAETGLWDVILTNPDRQSDGLSEAFLVSFPPPSLTAIDPVNGTIGDIVPVTLTGNYFRTGATVNLTNGISTIPVAIAGISASEIRGNLDLDYATAGVWDVTVTNPGGQSDTIANAFTVNDLPSIVTAINPVSGITGQTVPVTITGSRFSPDVSVKLAKTDEPDITAVSIYRESDTTILCHLILTDAAVGPWDVVVTNPGTTPGVLPAGFLILYPEAPEVLNIEPSTGVNTGIQPITNLSGTGFKEGATVILMKEGQDNITGTNVAVINPQRITCNLDLDGALEGFWDVVVTNDDGQSGVQHNKFQVTFPGPEILGVSPTSGINTAAILVTIQGASFRSPAAVKLVRMNETDIEATNVTVVNATTITCSLPITNKQTGPWNLVVINPDGQYDIASNIFTIENPAPTVTSITPGKGQNDGSVFISALQGTGFLQNATVQLTRNGYAPITATGVTVESPTLISCTLNLTGRATGSWNVVVINTDGKAGGRANAFTITPPLSVPNFTASPELGTAPLTVQFTDLSTNNPTQWRWDFGDGSVMTGNNLRNPVHTYNDPGVYTVELMVWNAAGQTLTSATRIITVVETPVASFTADPVSGPAPLFVQFTDTSDGIPLRWLWKFGDGRYSTQQNPYYVYEKPGLYDVTLTVSNKAGSNTATKPNLIEVTSLPEADFTANRTSGTSPLSVKFTDASTGNPTSWVWKFGDNGTSTQKNPVHVYALPGTYSVQLTVSNSVGTSTETKSGYIVVGDDLMAEFEYTTSNSDNTAPLTVAFMDRSTGKPTRWSWKFGDGYLSTDKNPIHTYTRPGQYTLTLTVSGSSGSDSVTKSILVKSLLKAEFVAEPTTGSAPLTVRLSDTSIGEPSTRNWIFIDPADPEDLRVIVLQDGPRDLVYTFNEPGLYTVLLDVWDVFGEEDVAAREDYIHVFPFP